MLMKSLNYYQVKLTQHLSEHNLYKIFAVSWTILIFYLCLEESPKVPNIPFEYKDKVVHFTFYLIFVFLWTKSLPYKSLQHLVRVLFLAIAIGILIEVLQENFTLHRTFDWLDILANTLGAITSFTYVKKFVQ